MWQENRVDSKAKFRYLVILNEKFLTQLASGLTPKTIKVSLRIGIIPTTLKLEYLHGNDDSVALVEARL